MGKYVFSTQDCPCAKQKLDVKMKQHRRPGRQYGLLGTCNHSTWKLLGVVSKKVGEHYNTVGIFISSRTGGVKRWTEEASHMGVTLEGQKQHYQHNLITWENTRQVLHGLTRKS